MKIVIKKNIILAPFTTFKIGGPAKFFCEITNEEELEEALKFSQDNDLAVFLLGGGSNILFSDEGFDGLVIHMLNTSYFLYNISIECGAGLSLAEAVKLASHNSLTGLEWAAGIPGTIGGAVRGNAGAYGSNIANSVKIVKAVEFSPKGDSDFIIRQYNNAECQFSYRNSLFKKNPNLFIISSVLELKNGDKPAIAEKIREILKKRAEKLPKKASIGSIFENPTVEKEICDRFRKDCGAPLRENKVPAGWLIEEAGLKGKKVGGAQISEEHSNVIINNGKASAQEVISLISLIKMKVRDVFGVELKEEIKYVGF